jgi:uncharacterized protein DUF6282
VTIRFPWQRRPLSVFVLAAVAALGLFVRPIGGVEGGQSRREADGARLLRGAVDLHWHVDASHRGSEFYQRGDVATVKLARSRGMRALVLKHHNEPTAGLAYIVRLEVPDFDVFGGIVLNLPNGGINPAAVKFMATETKGAIGRVVWMPAGDTEAEARASKEPNRPFVRVSQDGRLLPEVKEVISVIAKHRLALASGHIAPEDALMVFREARSQGVERMIATHPMELAGKMTLPQMQEAAKLGAIIEVDFRNALQDGRMDNIRALGPEHCFISEFWTKNEFPVQYAGLDGVGAFAAVMREHGFTDADLDIMFKRNPARLLGLPVQ